MKIYFNLNSQGNKNRVFSPETYDFQVLENEALTIAGYKAIKIFTFLQLAVKLWLKEYDDLQTTNS